MRQNAPAANMLALKQVDCRDAESPNADRLEAGRTSLPTYLRL